MRPILEKLSAGAVLLFGAALIHASPVWAQDSGEAETKTVVVLPLTLVKDEDLDFGLIIPGSSVGYVVLSPDNTKTVSGGVVATAGTTKPATFYGYGRYRQYLRLNVDANTHLLRRQGGSETMRLDRLTIGSSPPTTLTTNPRLFYIGSPSGFFGFSLGGRLRVGANQVPGIYTGKFTVQIEYY